MFKKSIICFMAIIFVLLTMSLSYASDTGSGAAIEPNYDNAISATSTITISGGAATIKSTLTGKPGVTKIKCTMTLQKNSSGTWNNVQSWSKEVNATTLSFKKTYSVSHGTYRSKAVFKVYKGASCETITKYSSQVTY